ncbi:MAG: Ketose-bisphosphate aldolase, class-II [Parcubacteria group bacterium Gr01-1014_17]|nr:MAG: Ketose-bisphosphate aldolase, class-II [Parcubacteria group bacterium Gr01-1014_17]
MQTLRECIAEAEVAKRAIGHFNFSNLETLRAIVQSARAVGVPVIVGLSEGERSFVGLAQAVALVRSFRDEYGHPIFLNADHSYSFEKVKEAVDVGFDAVIVDGAGLPFAENAAMAKECVAYARASGRDVVVEGELGFIGKASQILKKIPDGVKISPEYLTAPEDAARFAQETGVDLFAPAVGNIHGMLEGGADPALDIARIRAIREAAGVPLVLHGASGNSAEDIRAAIAAGVAVVHINTELRAAYRKGLVRGLEENQDELAPYKYLKEPMHSVVKVVEEKLKIFNT